MCGINGFNFNNRQLIEKMNVKLEHRGPDQGGIYLTDNFSLGHRRLSIIDLSDKAAQPMFNENKSLALVFNGEIYNYKELRQELIGKGHKIFSKSDSEVILHLYEDEGVECLKRLNGIFALAILDIQKNELFMARDRIGVKPLYYYYNQGRLIFSSEIKAILEHPIKREIDFAAFNHYFRLHYVPQPFTIFKNISKLPPASYALYKNKKLEINQYWQLNDFENIQSENEIVEQIQSLMKQSVKGQLISDRPVGIFLSGGVDSTSVLGVASELGHKDIKTFSVGFDMDHYNEDFKLAKKTSQHYGTDHHELIINGKDVLNSIEKVIYHLDEPVANTTQPVTYLLSKFAKEKVAVVLGGDGGDELFGGYKRYRYSLLSSQWQTIPSLLRNNLLTKLGLRAADKYLKKGNLAAKLNIKKGVDRYLHYMSQKDDVLTRVLKTEMFKSSLTAEFYKDKYFSAHLDDFEKQFMLTDLKTWLVDESLMRTDKMSMAFGLEERVPVLDHRLAELSVKIPSSLKLRDGGKYIFKKAMASYLPDHVRSAPKRGWFSPIAKWLRDDMKEFSYDVLKPDYFPTTSQYFNWPEVRTMLDDHISKKQYNLNALWILITWQVWAKQYL